MLRELIAVTAVGVLCSCSGMTYNGVRGEDIRNMNANSIAGVATTMLVHTASHYIAAAACGVPMTQDGLTEHSGPATKEQEFIIGAAGYVGQLAVGYLLKATVGSNDFTRGYNTGTLLEIGMYPVTDNWSEGSDLRCMKEHASVVWGLSTVAAIGLNINNSDKE